MGNAIKDRSAEAAILIGHFSILPKGTTVTYEEIEKLIGYDIRNNRGPMQTARTRLRRDHGRVLRGLPGEGYKVLTDDEVRQHEMRRDREHWRRHAKKTKEKASTVDITPLNDAERLAFVGEIQVAHVVASVSTDKAVARVASQANGNTGLIALNKSLEALKRNVEKDAVNPPPTPK